jgi:Bacterial regulatory proteins, luxR family
LAALRAGMPPASTPNLASSAFIPTPYRLQIGVGMKARLIEVGWLTTIAKRITEFWGLLPMNWEAQTVLPKRSVCGSSQLMVAGCTNVVIADRLCITVGTVKTHVRNILAKFCADDRTEADVRALRAGIIS